MEIRNQNSDSLWLGKGIDWKGALEKFLELCCLYGSLVTCGSGTLEAWLV